MEGISRPKHHSHPAKQLKLAVSLASSNHQHTDGNNQQLAFANTITALTRGVSYLDATVNGMGRGAGNCASEQLLGFLKNPKYDIIPLLKFLEKHIVPLRKSVRFSFVAAIAERG